MRSPLPGSSVASFISYILNHQYVAVCRQFLSADWRQKAGFFNALLWFGPSCMKQDSHTLFIDMHGSILLSHLIYLDNIHILITYGFSFCFYLKPYT